MGSHHLEYGFPSTHSTNSVSIALYLASWVGLAYAGESIWCWQQVSMLCGLAFYAVSVVFGRLYCGMHSVMGTSLLFIVATLHGTDISKTQTVCLESYWVL